MIAFTADITSEAYRSIALAWVTAISLFGFSIFSVLVGYASDMIGIGNIFYFFGVFSLIGAASLIVVGEDKSWQGKSA